MTLIEAVFVSAVKREFQGKQVKKITEDEIGTVKNVEYRNGQFILTVGGYSNGDRTVKQDQFGYYGIVELRLTSF